MPRLEWNLAREDLNRLRKIVYHRAVLCQLLTVHFQPVMCAAPCVHVAGIHNLKRDRFVYCSIVLMLLWFVDSLMDCRVRILREQLLPPRPPELFLCPHSLYTSCQVLLHEIQAHPAYSSPTPLLIHKMADQCRRKLKVSMFTLLDTYQLGN